MIWGPYKYLTTFPKWAQALLSLLAVAIVGGMGYCAVDVAYAKRSQQKKEFALAEEKVERERTAAADQAARDKAAADLQAAQQQAAKDKVGLFVADQQDAAFRALSEGRYDEAEVEATKGLVARHDALCLLWRACARQQTGREKEAFQDAEAGLMAAEKSKLSKEHQVQLYVLAAKLIKSEADRIESNFGLGEARESYDRAAAYCRRALDLVPDDDAAVKLLSKLPR